MPDAPPKDSRAPDYLFLGGVGCLVVSLLMCGVGGAVYVWAPFADQAREDLVGSRGGDPDPDSGARGQPRDPWGDPVGVTPVPVGGGGGSPPPMDQAALQALMRQRYRPGPYVQVQGLLPSGLTSQRRLADTWRGGRTVDNPWIVAGAELRPGLALAPLHQPGPAIALGRSENTSIPLTVVPGSAAEVHIDADPGPSGDPVAGLLIWFEGYQGHFYLPATVDSELGLVRVAGVDDAAVHFGADAPTLPGGAPADKEFQVEMLIASVDTEGRVSAPTRRTLEVVPVGTGDVEVTVSMTQATDLDLYVVDPTGTTVYYGNDDAGSGGHLDLDANAACGSNMGVNNEHVFWPRGQAPAGTYVVRLAHYESCIGGGQVDYRVTVRNCGETAVFTGTFTGQGDSTTCLSDPGTRREWCQNVVSFDVTPCASL